MTELPKLIARKGLSQDMEDYRTASMQFKNMGTKVFLTTWVKVKENWRDSDFLIRNFGYQ